MPPASSRSTTRFEATLVAIDGITILRLPDSASKQMPSRGQVAVRGAVNGYELLTVLEPDGAAGHWMKFDPAFLTRTGLRPGDTASVDIEPTKEWPEPHVPGDLQQALSAAPQKIQTLWREITPMARWEWVRWVNATANAGTRDRRVEVTISKMQSGKRRPCCFNLSACTDPQLSKNGRLRDPA